MFFATAPRAGTGGAGMTGTEIRLACAQPGDQIAIFGEALQEIASRSAHLYRDGDSYWFSPQATLNKLAADRARDVTDEYADRRIVELLREEQRGRAGFPRVHAAPDNPTDIEDRRATALVVLPPSAPHDASSGAESKAAEMAPGRPSSAGEAGSDASATRWCSSRRTHRRSRPRARTPSASAPGNRSSTTPT